MVIWQYKNRQILVAIWAINNIIAHRPLTTRRGVSSDQYRLQTTNNFKKLLDLEESENTSIITVPIFLVLYMHIRPTRLLEDSAPNAKFDANGKLRTVSTSLDGDDSAKIQKAIAVDKDNQDKKEDR